MKPQIGTGFHHPEWSQEERLCSCVLMCTVKKSGTLNSWKRDRSAGKTAGASCSEGSSDARVPSEAWAVSFQ